MNISDRGAWIILAVCGVLVGAVFFKGDYVIAKAFGAKYHRSYMTENHWMAKKIQDGQALAADIEEVMCHPDEDVARKPKYVTCFIRYKDGNDSGYATVHEEAKGVKAALASDLSFAISWSGRDVVAMVKADEAQISQYDAADFAVEITQQAPKQDKARKQKDEQSRLAALPEAQRNKESWK